MTKNSSVSLIRCVFSAVFALLQALGATFPAQAAATLLPNGQQCFSANSGQSGMVGALGTITGGSGGTAGTYGGVALTGGAGSGATANITVAGGAVTAVTILNPGSQYLVGDILSASAASIGNTTGFTVPVLSVAINSSLAGGSVSFFFPNTNTFKQTWQNSIQTVLNTNPVTLDQNGCATIYGTGSYRQVVKDSLGNTVWDKITTDTSAQQNTFWAGIAAGTPNAITITDPGFNATDGSIINFTALATNTSATTINPSAFGAVTVLKDTTGGPVGLTGGEIVQNNPISAIYRSVDNAFHLLNTAIASASGASAPLCGATNLKITNGGTPNSVIALTADQIVMQTPAGITINRSNVSLTGINITTGTVTATANGMDGESPGANNWLDIFAIDNGAAPAGLVTSASGNAKAPVMPSGYTFKCYLGAMRVDGGGLLFRTLQRGKSSQWVVTPATTTATLPVMVSTSGASVSPFVTVSTTNVVPPTATKISTVLVVDSSGAGTTNNPQVVTAVVTPNNNVTSSFPCRIAGTQGSNNGANETTGTVNGSIQCSMLLETTNIFWGATFSIPGGSSASVSAFNWEDAVNAN